jgi:hypothetical protein
LFFTWRIVTREESFRNVKQMHMVISYACVVWQQNCDKWFLFCLCTKGNDARCLFFTWRTVTREASFHNVKQMFVAISYACERRVRKSAHGVNSSGSFALFI